MHDYIPSRGERRRRRNEMLRTQELGKNKCPGSGVRSARVNRRDQCEVCGRVLTVDAEGKWPVHGWPR